MLALALIGAALLPSAARAQLEADTDTVTPPASDYVVEGPSTRLELVLGDGARRPTDLIVRAGAGDFACHLPCALNIPSGVVELFAEGLSQRFELQLPVARFRVRAGDPVPWLESVGGIAAGLALGAVGTYAIVTSPKTDEVTGGAALLGLGALLVGLCVALIIIGVVEEDGSVELDAFETALRDGGVWRF